VHDDQWARGGGRGGNEEAQRVLPFHGSSHSITTYRAQPTPTQLRVAAFIKALHEVTRAELHRGFD